MKLSAIQQPSTNQRVLRLLRVQLTIALGLAAGIYAYCVATPSLAQSSTALTAVYGRGVHAYFAGNTPVAEQHFTEVIQTGSTDPRPYYFRAMLRLGQGRQFEAENDMRIGAAYEARNPGVQNSIGKALQRVQGPGRRTLEQFRRQGRLDRLQQGQQQTQQRYEQLDRRGPAVLRRAQPLPLQQPIQPPRQIQPSQPATGSGTAAPLAPPPQVQSPAIEAPEPTAAQPAAPSGSDTRADTEDIFGSPAPVTPIDDPLGSEVPTPAPAPEAESFEDLPSPADIDDDPFGDSTDVATPPAVAEPAPAEEAPADAAAKPEAADEEDPFGESDRADEPAPAAETSDDPFGDSSSEEAAPAEAGDAEAVDEEMEAATASDADAGTDEPDPFGETSEAEASDDPFGDAEDESSAGAEEDPFGESSEAESSDPVDEPADEESTDEEPAPESGEDDPFGDDPFGAAPLPASDVASQASPASSSSAPLAPSPAGQMFFALGQWLGSRGNPRDLAEPDFSTRLPPGEVAQASFELGPTDDDPSADTEYEFAPREQLGSPQDTPKVDSLAEDDPFGF